jgi:hypothetical protein
VAINLVRTDDRPDAGTDVVVSMAIDRMIHYASHAVIQCRARSTMGRTHEPQQARRVPSMNVNRDQTLASLQRIAGVLEDKKAQLWINHDKPQSAGLRYAPAYYE